MRTVLTINGLDIIPYLAEDGIDYGTTKRLGRSVVTMDGKDHRSGIYKNTLGLTLLDMSSDQFAVIDDAISMATPAVVNYTDRRGGLYTGSHFYVEPPSVTGRRTIGDITYLTGISITMEEE